MTEPINPMSGRAAYESALDRRKPHTHPEPVWLRVALIGFACGLAIVLGLVFFTLQRVSQEAERRQAETIHAAQVVAKAQYDSCIDRRNNAVKTRDSYTQLLAQLQPGTDPAIRNFLALQRDASQRNIELPCMVTPPVTK